MQKRYYDKREWIWIDNGREKEGRDREQNNGSLILFKFYLNCGAIAKWLVPKKWLNRVEWILFACLMKMHCFGVIWLSKPDKIEIKVITFIRNL